MPSNKQVWVSKPAETTESNQTNTNQQAQTPQTQNNRGRGTNKPRGRGGYRGRNNNNKRNQTTNSQTLTQPSSTHDNFILDDQISEIQHDEHVHTSIPPTLTPQQPQTTKKSNNNSNNTLDNNKSLHTKSVNNTSSSTKEDEHSILAADIISRLTKNEYECIICCDVIRPQVAIWGCENCYMLFHLYCIKKWYNAAEQNTSNLKWRCPGCQEVHTDKAVPRCFCGKVKEPAFNPYITPHSCGEICGKTRKKSPDCPHLCNMMCHPGHCPPCSAMGPLKKCFCGATTYRLRCGEKDPGRNCENICGKTLNCGTHKCNQQCHNGPCGNCQIAVDVQCYCGKVHQQMKCGERDQDKTQPASNMASFTCKNPCGRTLDCGNHTCLQTCHKGPCQGCSLSPGVTNTCPCGKIPIDMLQQKPRQKCTDPIPTCPNVCGKTLACGLHKCKDTCHQGPCKDCTEEIKVPCRCHSSTVTMKCIERQQNNNKEILCNKICKANKSCGRHGCGAPCCPSAPSADPHGLDNSGAHICNLICGRKLKCGRHDCDLLCHKGRCPPCHTTSHEPYVCECGFTVVEPPILCSQKLPECPKFCVRPRACGHVGNHVCHSRDTPCPPCTRLVDKLCVGGHEIRKTVPCHINGVSCGRLCGKMLKCGIHTCKRSCHADSCDVSSSHSLSILAGIANRGAPWEKPAVAPPRSKLSCGQVCGKPKQFCEHICSFPCHPGEECPQVPCKSMTLIFCSCKRRSIEVECLRGGPNDTKDRPQRMLDCDEQCRVVQRNKKLAEAFGINIDNNSSFDGGIYSDLLKDLARACPKFIQNTEHIYIQMIKGLANPKYTFPPMDRLQRQMVHLLAESFRLDTESFERDPHRHVVVTRRKDSRIPNVLLSTITANEQASKRPSPVLLTSHSATPVSQAPAPAPSMSLSSSWEGFAVYTLHVFELRPEIRSENIYPFLHSFDGHYKLKWLDEANALVVFRDYSQMKDALHVLSAGPWKVRMLADEALENSNNANVLPSSVAEAPASKLKEKEPKPLPEFKENHPFQEDNNYFAALQGEPVASVVPPKPKKEKPRSALSASTAAFKPRVANSAWDDESENVFAKEQAFDEFVQKTKEATAVLRKEHGLDQPQQAVVTNNTPAESSWEQISEQ